MKLREERGQHRARQCVWHRALVLFVLLVAQTLTGRCLADGIVGPPPQYQTEYTWGVSAGPQGNWKPTLGAACSDYLATFPISSYQQCGIISQANTLAQCGPVTDLPASPFGPWMTTAYTTVNTKVRGKYWEYGVGCLPLSPESTPQSKSLWARQVVTSGACPANASIPPNETSCVCDKGFRPGLDGISCVPYLELASSAKGQSSCDKRGNPIYPATATKVESVSVTWIGRHEFRLTYDSSLRAPLAADAVAQKYGDVVRTGPPVFGELWSSSLHRTLVVEPGMRVARAERGDGRVVSFSGDGTGIFNPDADVADRLTMLADGFSYFDTQELDVETYSLQGKLLRIDRFDGSSLSFQYSDANTPATIAPEAGLLISVSDNFGRSLNFQYVSASPSPRVKKIIDPTGRDVVPEFDTAGRLVKLNWQDLRARQFVYADTGVTWALKGVEDELGTRYATFEYDSAGRAVSTVGSSRVDLQACKLEYSIVSPK